MRTLVSLGILGLVLTLASPASAQMCGGSGQSAGTSAAGGMCGSMGQSAAGDPVAEKPAQPQQSGMMCPCCKNMTMMGGGRQGSPSMPGMEMPKQ
jgi:hypothetical protein